MLTFAAYKQACHCMSYLISYSVIYVFDFIYFKGAKQVDHVLVLKRVQVKKGKFKQTESHVQYKMHCFVEENALGKIYIT